MCVRFEHLIASKRILTNTSSALPTLAEKLAASRLFVPSSPENRNNPTSGLYKDPMQILSDRVAQIEKALEAERTAHLATIAELRNASSHNQHTGIDPDVVSNLAMSLACGEQSTNLVVAGLLDEVERGKTWDPTQKSIPNPVSARAASRIINRRTETRRSWPPDNNQPKVSLDSTAISAGGVADTERLNVPDATEQMNMWGLPSVPTAPPRPLSEERAVPQSLGERDVSSMQDTDAWCAAHPMSRLKALEGVVDIALGRIAELEKKAAGRDMARMTRDTMLDVHQYDDFGV